MQGRRRVVIAGLRGQLHARPARLGETDRDGLLRRAGAMLALADMMNLFAHEFAGLRRGCLALSRLAPGALHSGFLGHVDLLKRRG